MRERIAATSTCAYHRAIPGLLPPDGFGREWKSRRDRSKSAGRSTEEQQKGRGRATAKRREPKRRGPNKAGQR